MSTKSMKSMPGAVALPMVVLLLAGCATVDSRPVIKPGDEVGIHFTCRFPGGEVAATTHKGVADDPLQHKAAIFLTVKNDETIPAVAGGKKIDLIPNITPGFEEEILRQLSQAVVGMRLGEERALTLAAETRASRGGEDQKMELARNRRRAKEIRIPLAQYKDKSRKNPELGNSFATERGFQGKITALTEQEVVVTVTAVPGTRLATPFGAGVIRDRGDHYEIELEVKEGDLVRSGALVGRISEVKAENFTVDYSNPFAGLTLDCNFSAAKSAEAGATADGGKGVAGPVAAVPQGGVGPDAAGRQPDSPPKDDLASIVSDAITSGSRSLDLDLLTAPGQAATTDQLPAAKGDPAQAAKGELALVAKGDLATVRFTVKNPDGTALTLPEGSAEQGKPQELIAGREELFPGIDQAVLGMTPGERKQLTLAPEKGFGPRNETKVTKYPLAQNIPSRVTLSADDYVKRFGGFPVPGKEVPVNQYLNAQVAEIGEKEVTLKILVNDGVRFTEPYGTVTVTSGPEGASLKLTPTTGAVFPAGEQRGVISASDENSFTVDFNHPLAGKTLVVDLELIKVTKAASLASAPVSWVEEHDAGLARAKAEGKPVFLILYADWCGWCKKTLTETIPDPRITELRGSFVWVKVNSDKEAKYKDLYHQNGFPLMLVLNPDGSLRKRIDGYRDARGLKEELQGVI